MLRKLVIPTAIVTAFAFTPVLAEQSGDMGGSKAERQHEMETGSQGTTAGTQRAQSFDELDQNQDGKLDEEELNVWGSTAAGAASNNQDDKDHGERMLQRYDHDGDGAISKDEMEQGPMTGTDTSQ